MTTERGIGHGMSVRVGDPPEGHPLGDIADGRRHGLTVRRAPCHPFGLLRWLVVADEVVDIDVPATVHAVVDDTEARLHADVR